MRRLLWLVPACGAAVAAALLLHRPAITAPKSDDLAATALPISNVVLFSSGVGYFQREGEDRRQ